MNKKSGTSKAWADKLVRGIRRKPVSITQLSELENATGSRERTNKIRVVLAGLRGEESIASLCRREGISESLHYSWTKAFLETGKRRLAGDTTRQATSPEVKDLRSQPAAPKEVAARCGVIGHLLGKGWQRPVMHASLAPSHGGS